MRIPSDIPKASGRRIIEKRFRRILTIFRLSAKLHLVSKTATLHGMAVFEFSEDNADVIPRLDYVNGGNTRLIMSRGVATARTESNLSITPP